MDTSNLCISVCMILLFQLSKLIPVWFHNSQYQFDCNTKLIGETYSFIKLNEIKLRAMSEFQCNRSFRLYVLKLYYSFHILIVERLLSFHHLSWYKSLLTRQWNTAIFDIPSVDPPVTDSELVAAFSSSFLKKSVPVICPIRWQFRAEGSGKLVC